MCATPPFPLLNQVASRGERAENLAPPAGRDGGSEGRGLAGDKVRRPCDRVHERYMLPASDSRIAALKTSIGALPGITTLPIRKVGVEVAPACVPRW